MRKGKVPLESGTALQNAAPMVLNPQTPSALQAIFSRKPQHHDQPMYISLSPQLNLPPPAANLVIFKVLSSQSRLLTALTGRFTKVLKLPC